MKSEHHYIDDYLLRDQIVEMKREAFETLAKLKMRIYRDSIAKTWSNRLAERNTTNASYEGQ